MKNNNNKLIADFIKHVDETVNSLESGIKENQEYTEKKFTDHSDSIKKIKADLINGIEANNQQKNNSENDFSFVI